MKFFSTLAVAALAGTAIAAPAPVPAAKNTCGNNQQVSCCNVSNSPQKIKTGGFFDIFNIVLAPQSCVPINIPIWGFGAQQLCGNNVAQCCQGGSQSGFINIQLGQCVALPL